MELGNHILTATQHNAQLRQQIECIGLIVYLGCFALLMIGSEMTLRIIELRSRPHLDQKCTTPNHAVKPNPDQYTWWFFDTLCNWAVIQNYLWDHLVLMKLGPENHVCHFI